MAELARCTNGAFYDANSPEKLPGIFAAELDGLQRIVVQNLRLRVGRLDFCEALGLLSEYPTITLPDGRHEIAVGDLVSEEERMLVFGLEVLPLPLLPDGRLVTNLEGELLLSLEAVFDEIGPDGISSHTWSQTVKVVSVQEPGQVRTNTEVIPWVAAQRAGKAVADALRASDSGDLPKARSVLESEIRKLGEMGSDEATAEGLSMVRDTLTHLEEHGTFEGGDRKRRLYSSRSMQRMSSAEAWCSEDPAPSFKKPRRPASPPAPPAPPVA